MGRATDHAPVSGARGRIGLLVEARSPKPEARSPKLEAQPEASDADYDFTNELGERLYGPFVTNRMWITLTGLPKEIGLDTLRHTDASWLVTKVHAACSHLQRGEVVKAA